MKRRLNYTGRKRILRTDIRLRADESGSVPAVTVQKLNLGSHDLPERSQIVLEAQRQTTHTRVEIGTVEDLHLPVRRELPDFLDLAGVHFRVKVVGKDAEVEGQILAAADGLIPEVDARESATRSLLLFKSADLGQRVWQLVLSDDADWPLVLINKRVGDWHAFAMSEQFVAYAYPEILTRVAHAALVSGDMDDFGAWQSEWLRYFRWLGKDPIELGDLDEVDSDAVEEWVGELVETFCRKHSLVDRIAEVADE